MNNNYAKAEKALKAANLKNVEIVLNRGTNVKQCINVTVYDKSGKLIKFKKGNKEVETVSTSTLVKQEALEDLFRLIDEGKNPYANTCRSTCSKQDAMAKLAENISDEQFQKLIDANYYPAAKKYILEKMEILDEREKNILMLRFGLSDNFDKIQSLQVISDMYHITREAVRQLESTALMKLRNN